MRGDEAVLRADERVALLRRFDGENVESGAADAAFVQGFRQSGFIHEWSTAGVDYNRLTLHQTERAFADEVLRGIRQWTMQADHIGSAENVVGFRGFDACGRRFLPGALRSQHPHAERNADAGHGTADFTVADDSQGAAGQFEKRMIPVAKIRTFRPSALLHALCRMADVIGHFQQQRDDMLRDRRRAVTRHIRHDDAAFLRRDDIHHIESRGRDTDIFQGRQRGDDLARQDRFVRDHDLRPRATGHGLIQRRARVNVAGCNGIERLPGKVTGIGGVGVEKDDFHEKGGMLSRENRFV